LILYLYIAVRVLRILSLTLFYIFPQQTQALVVIPKAEVVRGNKQRRSSKSKDIPPTTVVTEHELDDCVIIEQPHRIKPSYNRNAGVAGNKEKPQLLTAKPYSLTASLTSRSAVVSC